jgi:UDPglucose 6-dehydrogenase
VPVGTGDWVAEIVRAKQPKPIAFSVVSCPEFLREGSALADFMNPARTVLGSLDAEAAHRVAELHLPLRATIVVVDLRTAEMIKYASNAFLATKISFINEIANICEALGADVKEVAAGMGYDTRIGRSFLDAGLGYGGSCFPKDVRALAALGRSHEVPMRLAEATHDANEEQAHFLAELVANAIGDLNGKTVAFWGLAFKPETDDVRESPALRLAETLIARGAKVVGHDPEAGASFAKAMASEAERGNVRVVDRNYEALDGACALVLLTEWRSYRAPNFAEIRKRLVGESPVLVDARNIWRPVDVAKVGMRYQGVGVPSAGRS